MILSWTGSSPGGRYFAAGKRSIAFTGIGLVTDENVLAYDLQTNAPVPLKGLVKKLIAGNFAFLAPDKVIGSNPGEPKKSGIVSFPNGEVIEQFEIFPGKIAAPAKGNYLLISFAALNMVISLYYYLRVVKAMFMDENENPVEKIEISFLPKLAFAICMGGVLITGLYSGAYDYIFSLF